MIAKTNDKRGKKNNNITISMSETDADSWKNNGLKRFIIIFSVAWFGIVAVYITKFFGWNNLFSMLPNEFSGFMAGMTLPLAIVWVIMAYIDRGNNFRRETQMLQNSLNQIIFPDSNGNAATKMLSEALKSQVLELKDATRDVCAQSDVIKRDLTERITEMKNLSEALNRYSNQVLPNMNDDIAKLIENFKFVAEKATTASADFRVNTMQMRDDSQNLTEILTPMVNQMVTAAQHVKEVVNVNNENIARAQEQLAKYSETSRLSISKIIESWAEKGENLERTFLRTAENCEELFRRLDSGISHIESSINEQKRVVETQSEMLNKNSSYLDNKLGEYGKLISLEVEAMVNRSSTLEQNIQTHLKDFRTASTQISDIFTHFGEDIVAKRKLLETEGSQVVNSIKGTIDSLTTETKRLKDFYEGTHSKNGEINQVVNLLSESLKNIENGLAQSINNFSAKSTNIIDQFQNLNNAVSGSINKLIESSTQISEQSKTNTNLLIAQDEYVNKALANLQQITGKIADVNNDLVTSGNKIGQTLNAYEQKMTDFGTTVDDHLNNLSEKYTQTNKEISAIEKRLKSANSDKFMKSSADVIAELEALSIDINSIFNKAGKDSDLWKQYYEGDKSAFARYLAKNMTKKQVVAIRDDYENKPDFRVIVDKYIDDFESLITAARNNERSSTLLAMISGSDVGKVYYVLARAIGKLN